MAGADEASGGQAGASLPPLLVKRYASRRLYNTETSDYVTLDDIAAAIRSGRDVRIVDLKSGEDLTRQYLLQIIAEHESRGENVLPVDILTDLVRSYANNAQSVVPDFLAASFEALRAGQSRLMEQMRNLPATPPAAMPGLDALRAQQQAFLQAMMSGWPQMPPQFQPPPAAPASAPAGGQSGGQSAGQSGSTDEMAEIRRQLAELQERISRL